MCVWSGKYQLDSLLVLVQQSSWVGVQQAQYVMFSLHVPTCPST
jgi:hypothetical protein